MQTRSCSLMGGAVVWLAVALVVFLPAVALAQSDTALLRDAEASALFTRTYRAPWVLPEIA